MSNVILIALAIITAVLIFGWIGWHFNKPKGDYKLRKINLGKKQNEE
jgi:hypothetical protein